MRRRHTVAALVAFTLVTSLAALGAPAAGAPAAPRLQPSSEYTVLIARGASRDAAVAAVAAAGGRVLRENAAIGMLTVRAPASGFVLRVSASRAVVGAAHVRPIGR